METKFFPPEHCHDHKDGGPGDPTNRAKERWFFRDSVWAERWGGPRLSPAWPTALILEKMLLHQCERKASAWRHNLCLCAWAVPTSPEQAKTQMQNKAQADPKGGSPCPTKGALRLQPNNCLVSNGYLWWETKTSVQSHHYSGTVSQLNCKLPSVYRYLYLGYPPSPHLQDSSQKFLNPQVNWYFGWHPKHMCVWLVYFYILHCTVVWIFCQDISMCQISIKVI